MDEPVAAADHERSSPVIVGVAFGARDQVPERAHTARRSQCGHLMKSGVVHALHRWRVGEWKVEPKGSSRGLVERLMLGLPKVRRAPFAR